MHTILVVDDSPTIRRMVRSALSSLRYLLGRQRVPRAAFGTPDLPAGDDWYGPHAMAPGRMFAQARALRRLKRSPCCARITRSRTAHPRSTAAATCRVANDVGNAQGKRSEFAGRQAPLATLQPSISPIANGDAPRLSAKNAGSSG